MSTSRATELEKHFGERGFLATTLTNAEGDVQTFQTQLADGTQVALLANGVLVLEPQPGQQQRRSVLLSCGIHGNETAPMEIIDRLVNDIVSAKVKLRHRLMIVMGNPVAAVEQQRFCEHNLNRMFSGKHQDAEFSSSLEGRRAELLERLTRQFFEQADDHRVHYDLHTAIRGSRHEKFAVYPLLHDRSWSSQQLGFLDACGIEAVLLSNQPSTTYSYYTSTEFKADAFTVELGSVKPFGANDLSKFSEIETGLRRLVSEEQVYRATSSDIKCYTVVEEIIRRSESMEFSFADDELNFTAFKQGQLLVSDGDFEYRVKRELECIVFPHKGVPIGQRALLIVAPYTMTD